MTSSGAAWPPFRTIPCLLLSGAGLVKTRRFDQPVYLGDPINVVHIFNDKAADELILLDILATAEGREPSYRLIEQVAGECFTPITYGGGIRDVEQARRVLRLGAEKVAVNTAVVERPALVRELSDAFGSQSVVVAIDVGRAPSGAYLVRTGRGRRDTGRDPVDLARQVAELGAGEILLNDVDRDGTMAGYDLELVRRVAGAVDVPVIACGGAGSVPDLVAAVRAGASAAAAGSLFVFIGPHRAVLITFPTPAQLQAEYERTRS